MISLWSACNLMMLLPQCSYLFCITCAQYRFSFVWINCAHLDTALRTSSFSSSFVNSFFYYMTVPDQVLAAKLDLLFLIAGEGSR